MVSVPHQPRPARRKESGRPYLLALVSLGLGLVVSATMVAWAKENPEAVLIGLAGRHDATSAGDRLASCLDCHVPFVGTPGSRCLSPGCHAPLATGSPPRDGKAMPIRFHVALGGYRCGLCHVEHDRRSGDVRPKRRFVHGLIPVDAREQCSDCHSAAAIQNHARADTIQCSRCHRQESWRPTEMKHEAFKRHHCDDCHVVPDDQTHASIAGTCSTCHVESNWDELASPKVQ